MSVPKIIHYCWFGGEIPKRFQRYIKEWSKKCPDYQIIKWDKSNYDLSSCDYLDKAVKSGKGAFVADYVRLDILYRFGGIYLDTDVELLKSFDEFLEHNVIFGFETGTQINGAIIIAEKENPFIGEVLKVYQSQIFENKDIVDTLTPIPYILSKLVEQKGIILNGNNQTIDNITVLSRDYFYPLSFAGEGKCFSNNTVAIHQYAGTWSSNITKIDVFLKKNFSVSIQPIIRLLSNIKKNVFMWK